MFVCKKCIVVGTQLQNRNYLVDVLVDIQNRLGNHIGYHCFYTL